MIQPVPSVRIQERIVEQISVVQQTAEKIAYCVGDQIVEVPVHLITEKIVDHVFGLPQERAESRHVHWESVYCVSSL